MEDNDKLMQLIQKMSKPQLRQLTRFAAIHFARRRAG